MEVAQLLKQHKADWDLVDRTGSTALHWAVDEANLDMIRWMLQDGCRVDVKDETSGDSRTVVKHAGSGLREKRCRRKNEA